jgi:Leucine-rich repeat (LRR) protein
VKSDANKELLEWLVEQKAIENEITSVDAITRLDLSGRKLEALPESIGNLENLLALNLSNNDLSELPQSFIKLQKLTNLDIRRNRLKSFPDFFASMQFRSINAASNALEDISVLRHVPHLRVLDVSANALRSLEGSFAKDNELRSVNLAANILCTIESVCTVFTNVERLNISDNLIKELPHSISSLYAIEEIDASYNHIEKIDDAFFQLGLQEVDLSSNLLTSLHLHGLLECERIILDGNPFRKLEIENSFAPYLEEFSCDGCGLKEFSLPSSTHLRILCYSSNEITEVPKEIERYVALEEMDIDGNAIVELPDSLANLAHLETFYANGNPLSEEAKKVVSILDPEICDLNMKTGIVIEKAKEEDIGEMAKLIGVLFDIESDFEINYDKQYAGISRLFEHPTSDLLVAKYEGKVIGMITMQRLISSAEGDFVGQIEDLVVYEEYRKMGVGSRLLNKIRTLAIEYGYKRIQLAADMDNQNALQFYSRRGFKKTHLHIYHYIVA